MKIAFIILLIVLGLVIFLLLLFLKRLGKDLVIDTQTELKNFRWFKSRLSQLIKVQSRRPFPLTLAILDIDNFRRFNKTSIRLGDEMLHEFATHLHNQVFDKIHKRNVVRYRFGDEFAIIFENMDYNQAKEVLDSIANTFANNFLKVAPSEETHIVTFCYGLAEYKTGDTFESLTEKAEVALVKKKR